MNIFEAAKSDPYASSISRVDAEDILNHYGAENVFEMGDELIHSCLIDHVHPHHANGDQNPSASINKNTKQYNCFSYGGGSVFWFLEEMEGDLHKAVAKFGDVIRESMEDHPGFMERLKKVLFDEEQVKTIPHYSDRLIKPWEGMLHPYLTEIRGLPTSILDEYRVGWSEQENRIIMPHFFNGRLVGWQRRSIPKGSYWPATAEDYDQKYKNSPNFPKVETLFNYDKAVQFPDEVITTEGAMRVYNAESFPDRPLNVVSHFSAKVSKQQADLLAGFNNVYIWNDDDYAGYSGAYWALYRLYKRTNVYLITGGDLADMGVDEAMARKELAIPATQAFDYLKEKLGKGFKCPL